MLLNQKNNRCKKASFINEAVADQFIARLHKTSKRKKKPQSSYLCPKCLHWHITSMLQPEEEPVNESAKNKYENIIENQARQIENLKGQIKNKDKKIEDFNKTREQDLDKIRSLNRQVANLQRQLLPVQNDRNN